jgi:pyruvate formate lyase activating enzyme
MIVGGIQWMTLLDYPDRIAATLFTAGCNFRCPFCHNPELVLPNLTANVSSPLDESFFSELQARRGFLDAVVVSGGEPTMQADLLQILGRIKELGYLVKLDTNGTRPGLIQRALENGLVDFIAMDIKAPPDAYDRMSGVSVDIAAIKKSISVIMRLAPQYEFRTTAGPGLSIDDLLEIGRWLEGGRAYWLQMFQVSGEKGLVDESCRETGALEANDLEAVWQQLRDRFGTGGVRA